MSEEERTHQGQPEVPVPPPSDERDRHIEARVRMKLSMREPLDEEEQAWFARMPGDKEGRYQVDDARAGSARARVDR